MQDILKFANLLILVLCLLFGIYTFIKFKGKKRRIISFLISIITAIGAIANGAEILNINMSFDRRTEDNSINIQNITGTDDITLITGDYNTINDFSVENMSQEDIFLESGRYAVQNEDYDTAWSYYSDETLTDNPYAQINKAYLYSHGYGVEQDFGAAIEIYNSQLDIIEAKRNKLGTLIAANHDGKYNEQISELIQYFLQIKDDEVCNYLSFCEYGKSYQELVESGLDVKDLYNVKWDSIYQLELVEESQGFDNPPRDTGYQYYKFVGANYEEDDGTLPTYYYETYKLKYIELIDKITP